MIVPMFRVGMQPEPLRAARDAERPKPVPTQERGNRQVLCRSQMVRRPEAFPQVRKPHSFQQLPNPAPPLQTPPETPAHPIRSTPAHWPWSASSRPPALLPHSWFLADTEPATL